MKKQTLLQIIKNGGATLNSRGHRVDYASGFQVSLKDLHIIDLKNIDKILEVINSELAKIKKGSCLGLWVDDGKMYIDLSFNIKQFKKAVEIGKQKNQISVFDWSTKKCIYLAEV